MASRHRLLIATSNSGKLRELTDLLADAPYHLVSLRDIGISQEVEETGTTLEENAVLKAETYRDLSGLRTLADDSGLEVDALGGEPGVHSARYAGPDASDSDRICLLLQRLKSTPKHLWTARFRCVVAVAAPGVPTQMYDGVCEGVIVPRPRGDSGFGYDPVFLIPRLGLTMAELSAGDKNRISHRAVAAHMAASALAHA